MKKNLILTMAAAAMLAVGCSDNGIEDTTNQEKGKVILYANASPESNTPNTRLMLEDLMEDADPSTSGINVDWDMNDVFAIYNSAGNLIETFEFAGREEGTNGLTMNTFEQIGNANIPSGTYTAVYPATGALTLKAWEDAQIEGITQNSNKSMKHLETTIRMKDVFYYDANKSIPVEVINFEQELAMLTVTFPNYHNKTSILMEFDNADGNIYDIHLINMTPDADNNFTAYLAIHPCAITSRRVLLTYTEEGESPRMLSANTSVVHEKGKRYHITIPRF